MFELNKFSLIITTRCNLKCKLCCEYVPENKPFPDMTVKEADVIISTVFDVIDRIGTLHLTGGGEPFLHPHISEMTEAVMKYADRFNRLMLFTNSVTNVSESLFDVLRRNKDKIIVQLSHYGINPSREQEITRRLIDSGVSCKIEKYYGDDQSFGGWVNFGKWEAYGRVREDLSEVFRSCSVTQVLEGNWRTRDGKVHWCSRSQRGMDLGLIPDDPDYYVDLFDGTSAEEKREKFVEISKSQYISACDYCSGDAGTTNSNKRFSAAEQI